MFEREELLSHAPFSNDVQYHIRVEVMGTSMQMLDSQNAVLL